MNYKPPDESYLHFTAGCLAAKTVIEGDTKLALRRARATSEFAYCYCTVFAEAAKDIPADLCNFAMKTFCKNVEWATREMQALLMGPRFHDPDSFDGDSAPLSKEDCLKIHRLTLVLFGSFACVNCLLERRSLSRRTVRIFVEAWPYFTDSMLSSLNGSILSELLSKHFSHMVSPMICFTLLHVACRLDTQIMQNLLLDEDLPEIMSFLLLIDYNASPSAKALTLEPQVSATLMSCLETMKSKTRAAFLDKVLQHADLDWDSFTLHLFHLLKRFWDEERNYRSVATTLQSVVKLVPRNNFWTPNMKKKMLPLIPRIITGSSKAMMRAGASEGASIHSEIVKQCIFFCSYTFAAPPGLTWSVQLFHHGILRAIFNCIPAVARSPDDVQDALNILVRNMISSELIFAPVIDAASEAWKETIANKGEPKFEGDFFRSEWYFLKHLIMERAIHKEIFTMKTGGKFAATCNRTGCSTREYEVQFVRCAGCRMAIYCSIECRKVDWKQLHRNVCGVCFIPEDEHIRQRDLQCASSILSFETHRHRRGLKTLAQRKFPGIPLNDLTVVVDYSNDRKRLEFDIENYRGGPPDGKSNPPTDPLKDGTPETQEISNDTAGTMAMVEGDTIKYRRPKNAFSMLFGKMQQGKMWLHAFHNGEKMLTVPEDDDLRPNMPATARGLRLQGVDRDGNPVETTWDEFDEWLYRIEKFWDGDPTAALPSCSFDHLVSI